MLEHLCDDRPVLTARAEMVENTWKKSRPRMNYILGTSGRQEPYFGMIRSNFARSISL